MLGGLYGDLPSIGGDDQKKSSLPPSWANSKIAPIIRKPAFVPPPSVLRAQSGVAAVRPKAPVSAVANRPSASPAAVSRWTGSDPAFVHSDAQETFYASAPAPPQPAIVGATAAVIEEYDPARPNDYDDFCRERRRRKLEEEVRRDLERRRQEEEEREKELIRQRELALQKSREMEANPSSSGDARTSSLGISGEEAWKRRAALSAGSAGRAMPEASPKLARSPSPPPTGLGLGAKPGGLMIGPGGTMSAAERMMAKMGWKAGEGLGKDRQGMTTPLMARKIDKRAGVIVNASAKKVEETSPAAAATAAAAGMMPPPPAKAKAGVPITGPATRVLLLRNMVGSGEVDAELEEEVKEECTKYGPVSRVVIYEITDPSFPVTEAVRIFIQFDRSESAMKALVDLDGRFFGGRVVRASFYDEAKYGANQLVPQPGEIPADTGTEA